MLKVTYNKHQSGLIESRVRSEIGKIAVLWDDLESFERLFELAIKKIPRINHINAEHAYRLKASGTNVIAVWHYTPFGNPDRLVATVKYEPDKND